MSDTMCLRDAEIELMEAAYGDCFKLIQITDSGEAVFDVIVGELNRITIRFYMASDFPDVPLRFRIDGNIATNSKRELDEYLQSALTSDPDTGRNLRSAVVLPLIFAR